MANVRVQIDFPEERIVELERLMKVCAIPTKKELLNNALSLFSWAVKEVGQQRKIASLDEASQQYRELQMPALQAAASYHEPERKRRAAQG